MVEKEKSSNKRQYVADSLIHSTSCQQLIEIYFEKVNRRLEDLTVLQRSPDLLNNVKIGQDQLRLIMKHILFYGGWGHFGQVT